MTSRKLKIIRDLMRGNGGRYLGAIIAVIVAATVGFVTPLLLEETIDAIRARLEALDIDSLSPREALDLLYELKREAGSGV